MATKAKEKPELNDLASPLMDDVSEMDDIPTVFTSTKTNKTLKCLERISKICGYANAPMGFRGVVGFYIILMNILVIQQTFGQHVGYCVYLNLYLIIIQLESLAIFIFGVILLNNQFLKELFQHLSIIGETNAWLIVKKETIIAILWISINYGSGYIGINDGGHGATVDGINDIWAFLWYYSCITDFIKYIACFVSILLIRTYFNTFPFKLQWIRIKLDVMRRNTFYNDIEKENVSQYEMEMLNNNRSRSSVFRPNLARSSINSSLPINRLPSQSNNPALGGHQRRKTYITKSEITHFEFKHEFQKILYLYRNLCNKLKFFVVIYLILNSLCFIFVSITMIKLSSSSECNINSKYYVHYVLELIMYFLGWIAIIIPFAENHRLLRSFSRDVIATKVMDDPFDQILIQQYLNSCVEASPFSIGYMTPTYFRIFTVLYAVFIIVGGQLISFYHVDSVSSNNSN